eukprot:173928-Chlamydomonas_euryale.AAC.3
MSWLVRPAAPGHYFCSPVLPTFLPSCLSPLHPQHACATCWGALPVKQATRVGRQASVYVRLLDLPRPAARARANRCVSTAWALPPGGSWLGSWGTSLGNIRTAPSRCSPPARPLTLCPASRSARLHQSAPCRQTFGASSRRSRPSRSRTQQPAAPSRPPCRAPHSPWTA